MAESIFMKADEVMSFLGVSKTEAYRIIKAICFIRRKLTED